MKYSYRILSLALCLMFLSSCSSNKGSTWSLMDWSRHTPKSSGTFKVGNPYRIAGKRYVPRETYNYNESGIASWYGPKFHGKLTANGEIYDQYALTAAHKTLQIPSIVRVTNLENGRSIVVRVNDRGPYSKGRIIDMSNRGADLLQFKNKGTAKVRLKLLPKESRLVAEAAKQGRNVAGIEIALNQGKTAEEFLGLVSSPAPAQQAETIKVAALSEGDKIASTTLKQQDLNQRLAVQDEGKVVKEEVLPSKNIKPAPVISEPLQPSVAITQPEPLMPMPQSVKQPARTANDVIADLVKKPIASPSNLYVQAASFSTKEKAISHAGKLSQFGSTDIQEVLINNQKYYRVRVGPVETKTQASEILSKMTNSGQSNAFITVGK